MTNSPSIGNPQVQTKLKADTESANLSIVAVTNAAYLQRAVISFIPHNGQDANYIFCMGSGENNSHMNVRLHDYSTDEGDFYQIGVDQFLNISVKLDYNPYLKWADVKAKLDALEQGGKEAIVAAYELHQDWTAYDADKTHIKQTRVDGGMSVTITSEDSSDGDFNDVIVKITLSSVFTPPDA